MNGGGGCGGWGWGEGSYGGRVLGAAGGQGWGKGNPRPPPHLAPFHNGRSSGPRRLWGCTQTPHCGSGGGGGGHKATVMGPGIWGGGSQPHLPSVPHCPQGHPSLCPPQTRFVPLGRVGMGHNGGPMGLGWRNAAPWGNGAHLGQRAQLQRAALWGWQWGWDAGGAPPPSSPINNAGCDPKGWRWGGGKPQPSLLPEGPISLCPHISMSPHLHVPISLCPHISVPPCPLLPWFPPSPCAPYHPSLGPLCPLCPHSPTSPILCFPPFPDPLCLPPLDFPILPIPTTPPTPPHSPPLSTEGFGVQGTEVALPTHGAGGVPAVPPTSVCPTSPTLNAPLPASPRFPVFNPLQPPPRWTQGLGWGGFGVQGVEVGVRVAVLTVLPSPAQRQCPHLPLHQRGGGLHPLPCGGGAA